MQEMFNIWMWAAIGGLSLAFVGFLHLYLYLVDRYTTRLFPESRATDGPPCHECDTKWHGSMACYGCEWECFEP